MTDPVTEALIECFGYDVAMLIDDRRAPTWTFECGDVTLSEREQGTVHESSHFALRQHVYYRIADRVEVDFFFVTYGFGERLHSITVTAQERAWSSLSMTTFQFTVLGHMFWSRCGEIDACTRAIWCTAYSTGDVDRDRRRRKNNLLRLEIAP